jgi:hypothetical protein
MVWFSISPIKINNNIVNILSIHDMIIELFRKEYINRNKLKERIEHLEYILKYGEKSDKTIAEKELKNLRIKYDNIINFRKMKEYVEASSYFISKYKKLNENKKSWIRSNRENKNIEEKINLTSEYLNLISNIIPIIVDYAIYICNNCKYSILTSVKYCPKCKDRITFFEDLAHDYRLINKISTSNYDKKDNFEEILLKYQGKCKKKPPENVTENIKNYCNKHKINYKTISKLKLRDIMKKSGEKDYYNDLNYIHYLLTGEKLPDLKDKTDKLLHKFDIYKKYFEKMKPKNRNNAYRAHYMIFQFGMQESININIDHFAIFETVDARIECDKVNKLIFETIQKDRPYENWQFFNID